MKQLKYIYYLIIFCLFTLFSNAQQDQCTLQLKSGDTISGRILAINDKKIKFNASEMNHQVLEIAQDKIKKLWFNHHKIEGYQKGNYVLLLSNGSIIFGNLLKLDKKAVSFHSDYTGRLIIPRSSVRVIAKANRKKITYLGPNNLDEWKVTHGNWTIKNGNLQNTTKNAQISKELSFSEHFKIDITLPTNIDKRCEINLFNSKNRNEYYQLKISDKNLFLVKIEKSRKAQSISLVTLDKTDENIISFTCNTKTGKVGLAINDKAIQAFRKHIPIDKVLSGMTIKSQSKNFIINQIKVTDLQSTELHIDGFEVKNNIDDIILDTDSTYSGIVTKADNEELIMDLESDQLKTFKANKINWTTLEAKKSLPSSTSSRVFLKNNSGYLHLTITKLTQDFIKGKSTELGEVQIKTPNISSIIFTPQRNKPEN